MDTNLPLYQTMSTTAFKRRHDPILEELWAIRAQINAEAGYDVRVIAERARIEAAKFIKNGRAINPYENQSK